MIQKKDTQSAKDIRDDYANGVYEAFSYNNGSYTALVRSGLFQNNNTEAVYEYRVEVKVKCTSNDNPGVIDMEITFSIVYILDIHREIASNTHKNIAGYEYECSKMNPHFLVYAMIGLGEQNGRN
jgi:hypothetical protein